MKAVFRIFAILTVFIVVLSCNLTTVMTPAAPTAIPPKPVEVKDTVTPVPTVDEYMPTPTEEGALPVPDIFDICTLVTSANAEKFFNEPAGEPQNVNGGCAFTNARDSLYAFSLGAAQEKEGVEILQGQAMLLGMAGIQMDETYINDAKKLAEALDYKAFFTKLATSAKGSETITAKLFAGGGNDLVYWAWITVPPRNQGAFVAVRGTTLVNINLVVPESQKAETMLNESNRLAGEIFGKLPEKFSINENASEQGLDVQPTPTDVPLANPESNVPQAVIEGLPAPTLISPADGAVMDNYPRNTSLKWSPVDGASKYLVEIMACSSSNPNNCFSHPMLEKTSRETNDTGYSFEFIGSQPGKWRVYPVDAQGNLGNPSGWWTFKYSK